MTFIQSLSAILNRLQLAVGKRLLICFEWRPFARSTPTTVCEGTALPKTRRSRAGVSFGSFGWQSFFCRHRQQQHATVLLDLCRSPFAYDGKKTGILANWLWSIAAAGSSSEKSQASRRPPRGRESPAAGAESVRFRFLISDDGWYCYRLDTSWIKITSSKTLNVCSLKIKAVDEQN